MRQSFVTINWRNKVGKRGLTEKTLETLRKLTLKSKKNGYNYEDLVNKLEKDYHDLKQVPIFDLQEEIKVNNKYVRVII